MRKLAAAILALMLVVGITVSQQTPSQILAAGSAYYALSDRDLQIAQSSFLSILVYGTVMSPNTILSNAAPFYAMSPHDLEVAETYLLSVVSATGGVTVSNITNTLGFAPIGNAAYLYVNTSGTTGQRGLITSPYPSIGLASSNNMFGDSIFLRSNTSFTNAINNGDPASALNWTNITVYGNGKTITTDYTNTDAIIMHGNVTLYDLIVTQRYAFTSHYLYNNTVSIGFFDISFLNCKSYGHETVLGLDVTAPNGSVSSYNSVFVQDNLTNSPRTTGNFGYLSGNGTWINSTFVNRVLGTNGADLTGLSFVGDNTNLFFGDTFEGVGGTNSNIGLFDQGSSKVVIDSCHFKYSASDHPIVIDTNNPTGGDVHGLTGDAVIWFSTGINLNNPSFWKVSNSTFNLAAHAGHGMTKLAVLVVPGGTLEFNNVIYSPYTNGVIIINSNACAVTVTGGNLQPANFSNPEFVTWNNLVVNQTIYPTNMSNFPDLALGYSMTNVGASYTLGGPINQTSGKTKVETTVFLIKTNGVGSSPWTLTSPAGVVTTGVPFVTNQTVVTVWVYGSVVTNYNYFPLN